MRPDNPRWHEVTPSEFAHEWEGLAHLWNLLPGRPPFRWQRGGRSEDSPLLAARRKAQRLKGVITDAPRQLQPDLDPRHIPYIQHAVFLHTPDGRCALPPTDACDLSGLDGHEPRSGLRSIASRLLEPPPPDGWQDWPAEHRLARQAARIRFFVSKPGASDAERATLAERLADLPNARIVLNDAAQFTSMGFA